MAIKSLKKFLKKMERERLFQDSIRPTDTFLVTYPKSGTTWMGFLIANVISQKSNAGLHLKNFIDIVPDINQLYFAQQSLKQYDYLGNPRVLMTHAPYDPVFPKVVYVLRDPRDVFVSYWHHKRLTDPNFRLHLKVFLLSDNQWPCTWNEHVNGWLLNGHANVLVVRYEDMHKNAKDTLKEVADFIGICYSDSIINNAVDASKFDKMQKLEDDHSVDGAKGSSTERFIRRGKVGSWRDELDDECLRILESKYGASMKQLGYKPVTVA
jgi:hypothetical protein